MMYKKRLIEIRACREARIWAGEKTLKEIWETCERGDWMLWLIQKENFCELKLKTLMKVECVELVAHLIKDERSKNALVVARKFAEGKATRKELDAAADADAAAAAAYAANAAAYADADAAAAAAYAANAAAYAAYADADAAAAAAYAANAAANAAADAAYAAAADAAYAAAAAAAAAAANAAAERKRILLKCADIVRKHLPYNIIKLKIMNNIDDYKYWESIFVKQKGENDCGIACLDMIMRDFFGIENSKDLGKIKLKERGMSMKMIGDFLKGKGFDVLGVKINYGKLVSDISYPLVCHYKDDHFVLVFDVTNENICVADPREERLQIMKKDKFIEMWSGNCLLFDL